MPFSFPPTNLSYHLITRKTDWCNTVTREEQAWESYSEAEEEVAASKVKAKPVTANVASVKVKKPVAKTGQGNIMSFFGKKWGDLNDCACAVVNHHVVCNRQIIMITWTWSIPSIKKDNTTLVATFIDGLIRVVSLLFLTSVKMNKYLSTSIPRTPQDSSRVLLCIYLTPYLQRHDQVPIVSGILHLKL